MRNVPFVIIILIGASFAASATGDIRDLSEHFSEMSDGRFDDWIFIPDRQVRRVTTHEHPGLASIHTKGTGLDVRVITRKPIRIDDFRVPWQFQCSFMQNFDALTGRTPTQVNYAIGLNLAVTFSNPSDWPKNRETWPPDTHSVQLLVVHLGNYGEAGQGLPQLDTETYPSPETYLVWGRGDIAGPAAGDWKIPHIYIGDGARYGGPASNQLYFRATVESPTHLTVGIKFDASHGWNIRHIDLSHLGGITGIWEIGPVMSADRWIPDVLAPRLRINGPPEVMPPDPDFEYFVDYCIFLGADPMPFEHHSDEFNIPGYMGQWQIQEQGTIVETYSNPGYLAVHLLGPGMGTGFGHTGTSNLYLGDYPPPWEIEICMIPPDNEYPWNMFLNFGVYSGSYDDPHWFKLQGKVPPINEGEFLGNWRPGILNSKQGGLQPHDQKARSTIQVQFTEPVPDEILGHKPLYMLIQVLDEYHLRLGYRARPGDPWYLSEVHDMRASLGVPIGQLGPHHVYSFTTGPKWGGEYGLPAYRMFLFDYVRYRYGNSIGDWK